MTEAEKLYHEIAEGIPESKEGKMFGALCIKAGNGKSGVMFWKEQMVFKLDGGNLDEALSLEGAYLFDPMGGRPMKEWVVVPYNHHDKWKKFSEIAQEKVKNLKK